MGAKRYDVSALEAEVGRFAAALERSGLAPSARFSYETQASRYVRWLAGEYLPRNAAPRLPRGDRQLRSWDLEELAGALTTYREELERARMQRAAVQTYVHAAGVFVRWLAGTYTPRAYSRGPEAGATTVDDEWLDEAAIQTHVVNWLRKRGWRVSREAHGHQHGVDIEATLGEARLAVEVKGHPRRVFVAGARAGERKRWHPAAQARTYYGNAVHAALTMVNTDPERRTVIALPNVPGYRRLFEQSRAPLDRLGIEVWFVSRDGYVETDRGDSWAR